MSERPVPPAGEEIHLPESSIQPLLVAVFTAIALVGITTSWLISAAGGIGLIIVVFRWIRDARHELAELPVDDH
jgi:hypothetical protein